MRITNGAQNRRVFFSLILSVFAVFTLVSSAFAETPEEEAEAVDKQEKVGVEAIEAETRSSDKQAKDSDELKKDAESSENGAIPIGEMVVTGNRDEEDPFEANRSINIVDKETLAENRPRTVPEALAGQKGIWVQETNYGGGSPIIRGLVGPQVLIVVDGVRFNNSVYRTGPLQYLNTIDQLALERIEVLRGSGSMLYGSDAMGGVIQLFPSKPRDWRTHSGFGFGGRALLNYSSADRGRTVHATGDIGYEGFSFLAGATYKESEDPRGGRGVGVQQYLGYKHYSTNGHLTYRFSEGAFAGWKLDLGYLFSRLEDAGRTDALHKAQLSMYDNDSHLLYAKAHMVFPKIETKGDITFSYQRFFEQKDALSLDEESKSTVLAEKRDETFVDTFGADLHFVTHLFKDRMRLNYGASVYNDWVDSDRYKKESSTMSQPFQKQEKQNYPDGSTYTNYGLFLMLGGDPLLTESGHLIRFSGGYRLHGFAAKAPAQHGLLEADFHQIGHVFFAGAQYLYKNHFNASFTFSQGFRAPNLQETAMLGDTGEYWSIPNNDLEAEKADTFELLLKGNVWKLQMEWTGYITLLRDFIARVDSTFDGETEVNGKTVVVHKNLNKGILYGTEAGLRFDIGWGFSAKGNIHYTWGKDRKDNAPDEPLSRIPPLFGQIGLRYDSPKGKDWRGYVETYVRAAAKQDRLSPRDIGDYRIPTGGTPSWAIWNAKAGVVAHDIVRLSLIMENLTDEKYKWHGSGVYGTGTNAIVSLEVFH